ncbi:DNA adenine methylase [Larsenimonas rhizosphaerae]|uniref:site-specific DNA-methyltransferase (adenine-specific) n=1 Tax=Larsenimonas rhizosphaerae TaxID=2944682 RepID=A0AA42CW26_9GAMM|nr:DNA adenine methylase [Larsenimonas rhizosphaerae]MCX2525486.1 DNA adenine methylase [Larsenimonas rhizosphaerae]
MAQIPLEQLGAFFGTTCLMKGDRRTGMAGADGVEVINDANGELVNLYRVVKHRLEGFLRRFKWALVSRQDFLDLKQTPPETLTDIQRAARFFYLQKNAFGGRSDNPSFGTSAVCRPRLNLLRIEEDLSEAHLRLSRTLIEQLPWEDCFRRYDRDETLIYLDPPYWGGGAAGYGIEFGFDQYALMGRLAHEAKG